MNVTAQTLDDLMNEVLSTLLTLEFDNSSTRSNTNGSFSEVIGASLHLENPRARLSRTETKGTFFSAFGELLWYLSGSNSLDFIKYYIEHYEKETDDGITIHGAYGPRLLNASGNCNQIKNVINLLKRKPSSRRAAIQIFEATDLLDDFKDIPCTCTIQLLLRNGCLHMVTYMRSNDAYLGLPHDVFAFTMLQELIAKTLSVKVGTYHHNVGSLHLYKINENKARQYLDEGVQPTNKPMPEMPDGDPWESLAKIQKIENEIRNGSIQEIQSLGLHPYWNDLIYLLQLYYLFKFKKDNLEAVRRIKEKLSTTVYNTFILKKFPEA